jgi:hypothetical protein
MEKTTYTISAAELAEAGTYPESTYVWTERTSPVQEDRGLIPVTDEQLDDVDQMAGLLDTDLRFGVQQKLDSQVMVGTGAGVQLTGIVNTGGIQTQARSTDPHFDAVFKALTKVRAVGRAEPDAISLHSTDWQTFRLMRTADGIYIMGNPAEPGPDESLRRARGAERGADRSGRAWSAITDASRSSGSARASRSRSASPARSSRKAKRPCAVRPASRLAVRRAAAFCTVTGL